MKNQSVMHISFILVEPAVPENVGAAARAIKTMGFSDLRLVNPCDYLCDKALMLAHGSHDILENAKIFSSLREALLCVDFSIATSAKSRWVKQDVISSEELPEFILKKTNSINSLAIVFGGEESGLSNEDIALCDVISSIPLAMPFPSLNLAQAVMIYAYSISTLEKSLPNKNDLGMQSHGYKALRSKAKQILLEVGITETSMVHGRVLERLSQIGSEDVNLLHSVTSKLLDRINPKS